MHMDVCIASYIHVCIYVAIASCLYVYIAMCAHTIMCACVLPHVCMHVYRVWVVNFKGLRFCGMKTQDDLTGLYFCGFIFLWHSYSDHLII